MRAAFEDAYRRRFAFLMEGRPIVVEAVSVEARARPDAITEERDASADLPPRETPLRPVAEVRLYSAGAWHVAPLYRRADLRAGDAIAGPAIIAEENQTTVVEPGWRAEVAAAGHLFLTRTGAARRECRCADALTTRSRRAAPDPVRLELFNSLLHGHRRADGRCAAEHGALGEHQGAARLLVRDLRRRRPA